RDPHSCRRAPSPLPLHALRTATAAPFPSPIRVATGCRRSDSLAPDLGRRRSPALRLPGSDPRRPPPRRLHGSAPRCRRSPPRLWIRPRCGAARPRARVSAAGGDVEARRATRVVGRW
ncbi:hypothetical protein U9M48_001113, partial [Paspalum notatum var. saurae]